MFEFVISPLNVFPVSIWVTLAMPKCATSVYMWSSWRTSTRKIMWECVPGNHGTERAWPWGKVYSINVSSCRWLQIHIKQLQPDNNQKELWLGFLFSSASSPLLKYINFYISVLQHMSFGCLLDFSLSRFLTDSWFGIALEDLEQVAEEKWALGISAEAAATSVLPRGRGR